MEEGKTIDQRLDLEDIVKDLGDKIKKTKQKKKEYLLDNSKYVFEYFETKKNIDDILNKNQSAHSLGISGVPVIALNDKIVIQGAESTELIISKIKQNN